MYLGIDVHKRDAQVAVMDEAGKIVEEVRVENANLDDLAQRYAGAQAAIEATSNYYHIHDTLSEHLDVTVAHPKELNQIADTDKKTDRVDAKELARMVRLNSVPESYVPTDEIREARALVRGRQSLVEHRTEYANKVHGLLSDHGISEEVKPLTQEGREFLRELSLPTPWKSVLESYLEAIETLTDEIQNLEETIEERAGSLKETQLLMTIPGVSGRRDFVLCEYAVDPDVHVQNVQQVRAVWTGEEWELHIVCRVKTVDPDPPGDRVAGIDLGICNFAAVAIGDEALLYPGGALKEDDYYFQKERAKCDDSDSHKAHRLDRKRRGRRDHFLHAISADMVAKCTARNVGTIAVGDLSGIREGTDWGDHGNLDLHGAFDRFIKMLEYKAAERGISVERVDERNTSKSCASCGTTDDSQRVERGLYVCESCGLVANADVNGAENIRQKVLPSLACDGGDRDNGWMAQPAVRLFDKSTGRVASQEQANREP